MGVSGVAVFCFRANGVAKAVASARKSLISVFDFSDVCFIVFLCVVLSRTGFTDGSGPGGGFDPGRESGFGEGGATGTGVDGEAGGREDDGPSTVPAALVGRAAKPGVGKPAELVFSVFKSGPRIHFRRKSNPRGRWCARGGRQSSSPAGGSLSGAVPAVRSSRAVVSGRGNFPARVFACGGDLLLLLLIGY